MFEPYTATAGKTWARLNHNNCDTNRIGSIELIDVKGNAFDHFLRKL